MCLLLLARGHIQIMLIYPLRMLCIYLISLTTTNSSVDVPSPTEGFATICGTVVNGEAGAKQSPIFGATILAVGTHSLSDTYPFPANSETTSDSLGCYNLTVMPGFYSVTATFDGDSSTFEGFNMLSGYSVTHDFKFYPNYEPTRYIILDGR